MFKKISYDVHKRERFHIESINIKILSINMSFFVSSTNNSTPIISSIFFFILEDLHWILLQQRKKKSYEVN